MRRTGLVEPLTEPEHRSDSVALETTAWRDGNEWVLNGRKRWIGNAVWCDVIVVYAVGCDITGQSAFT